MAYVVSGLAQKTGGRIDFERLWSRQSVSAELEGWSKPGLRRSTRFSASPPDSEILVNGSRRKSAGWISSTGCPLFLTLSRRNCRMPVQTMAAMSPRRLPDRIRSPTMNV